MSAVTIERLDRAIVIVAEMMVKHDRPRLVVTLQRLEAERDRLKTEMDPIEYAKGILARKVHNIVHNVGKPSRLSA
jgi:hypothetical protein